MIFGNNKGPKFVSPNDQMHPSDRRNLIIFIVAALVVYLSFDHFVLQPKIEKIRTEQMAAKDLAARVAAGDETAMPTKIENREAVLARGERLKISNGAVFGTLSTTGNRIDDIQLSKYFKTLGGSDHVPVLTPAGTAHPQYAEFGWLNDGGAMRVPDKATNWTVNGNRDLAKDKPVTMTWSNGQGLVFTRVISIDDKYMITVKQSVANTGAQTVKLYPYALVAAVGFPADYVTENIVHQGPIGYIGDKLHQLKYKAIDEKGEEVSTATAGWIGITEKYWLTALVPQQGEAIKYRFSSTATNDLKVKRYQADLLGAAREIAPGEKSESTISLFAGAKEVRVLDGYEEVLKVPHFDLAVDFGLYYFLTKPFFFVLSFFGHITGNFGIAIILMTILLRGLMYPLNNTSYRSFAKLKKIAPMMNELRAKHGDDKQALQKELIALYTKEKVNPAAGCLPILLQIPIFFALYKVLSVTIEMRHAPFFGWIHDLSVYDPTSVFNLFGLLPYSVPAFLVIGAWPIMMMTGMLIQQRLNPPPQDPVQARMMALMPYFMTFIMAKFAAGLVIYWTVSNILSVVQQYVISRSMGVEVSLFRRTPAEKELEARVLSGPDVHPEIEMIETEVEEALKPVTPPKGRRKTKR